MAKSWIKSTMLNLGIIGITTGIQAMEGNSSEENDIEGKKNNGWVTKSFRPSKKSKVEEKKTSSEDSFSKEENQNSDMQKDLKWDASRKMFYYGKPLPEQSTNESVAQPLKEDNTEVIFQINKSEKKEN
ncbi:MAG: hypothetical protein BGO67_04045 [Alphaproteobacteria bacterium 41-28]|nr:MAG: hypothetical protein BGO67_04045 [Alphaproteobacteria bacterium 41-28]